MTEQHYRNNYHHTTMQEVNDYTNTTAQRATSIRNFISSLPTIWYDESISDRELIDWFLLDRTQKKILADVRKTT